MDAAETDLSAGEGHVILPQLAMNLAICDACSTIGEEEQYAINVGLEQVSTMRSSPLCA